MYTKERKVIQRQIIQKHKTRAPNSLLGNHTQKNKPVKKNKKKSHDTKYNFSITKKKIKNKKVQFAFEVFIEYVKGTKMRKEMEESNFWPAVACTWYIVNERNIKLHRATTTSHVLYPHLFTPSLQHVL